MPRISDPDGKEICEFCRAPWREDDGHYNGGCCPRDELHANDDDFWFSEGNAHDYERERGSDDHPLTDGDHGWNATELLRTECLFGKRLDWHWQRVV